jgi:hypothetical protein
MPYSTLVALLHYDGRLLQGRRCPLDDGCSAYDVTRCRINILLYLHKIKFQFAPTTSKRAVLDDHLLQVLTLYGSG